MKNLFGSNDSDRMDMLEGRLDILRESMFSMLKCLDSHNGVIASNALRIDSEIADRREAVAQLERS